jgi:hypothetical protein
MNTFIVQSQVVTANNCNTLKVIQTQQISLQYLIAGRCLVMNLI